MNSITSTVAVPSSADSPTAFPNIRVPAGAKRINRITFALTPDPGTSATSIRCAPIFDLIGSGLGEQSPHEFLGSFGGWAMVTDGAYSLWGGQQTYETDLPVAVGSDITPRVNTLDEAVTAGTCTVQIEFDDVTPRQNSNTMSAQVNVAGDTTADRWTLVDNLTIPVAPEGRQPSKIVEVGIGLAIDSGTSAISLRNALRVQLTGAGLKGGSAAIELLGQNGAFNQVTAGASGLLQYTKRIDVSKTPIYVNPGGVVKVEHRFDVETPTASTVCVGFIFR